MESGTKLGHYEILNLLGKGGMGEVWRARDTKLGREVAIKTLPEEFAKDSDRLARFEREAKLLASLNHPNIAAIHGFEEDNGTHFLVLELVEGDTLADRVKRGAIPVEESLKLALQIAEALEAAHEKGVIHRDLKPANVKVTPKGKVKVLDFGLAKAFAGAEADVSVSNSPTLSMAATQQGVILGTAAYMSPEQAGGETTDKRADIWAFGVVLFEMLTGCQAFTGKNVSHVLAAVLSNAPDWTSLPTNLHRRIRLLLERCLDKEPKDRLSSISDARVDIQKVLADPAGVLATATDTAQAAPSSRLQWVAAVVLAILSAGTVWLLTPEPPLLVSQWEHVLSEDLAFRNPGRPIVALSPDDSQFVYNATGGLYLRSIDELDARVIPGTEDALTNPAFSPDGEWLAFQQDGQLKKIAVVGGASVSLADIGSNPGGISWDQDETILYSTAEGVMRVSADGGEPELLVGATEDAIGSYPQLLPGGNTVLMNVGGGGNAFGGEISLYSLESRESKILFPGSRPRYVPTGHILYAQDNVLFAVPFDVDQLEVTGGPVPLIEGVRSAPPQYAVSDSGSLAYIPGFDQSGPANVLALVGRDGEVERLNLAPKDYRRPRLSPNGRELAVQIGGPDGSDIWIYDLSENTAIRRLTQEGNDTYPVWTPDGNRVTFSSDRDGPVAIYWHSADGSGLTEPITTPEDGFEQRPEAWSPDGRTLVLRQIRSEVGNSSGSLWTLSLDGSSELELLHDMPEADDLSASFSPNGAWIAYTAGSLGSGHTYVQPFPLTGEIRQVTVEADGVMPMWSADGSELFYRRNSTAAVNNQSALMAVDVVAQDRLLAFGTERPLAIEGFLSFPSGRDYDITPNGQSFLLLVPADQTDSEPYQPQINVVLNWIEELKERVPVP